MQFGAESITPPYLQDRPLHSLTHPGNYVSVRSTLLRTRSVPHTWGNLFSSKKSRTSTRFSSSSSPSITCNVQNQKSGQGTRHGHSHSIKEITTQATTLSRRHRLDYLTTRSERRTGEQRRPVLGWFGTPEFTGSTSFRQGLPRRFVSVFYLPFSFVLLIFPFLLTFLVSYFPLSFISLGQCLPTIFILGRGIRGNLTRCSRTSRTRPCAFSPRSVVVRD